MVYTQILAYAHVDTWRNKTMGQADDDLFLALRIKVGLMSYPRLHTPILNQTLI